jgi:hypothetical protein
MASPAFAQEQTAAATDQDSTDTQSAAPLSEDELEVLVARIALYPDELIAVICGASLYPLQIVEAARFLDAYEKDNSLKPKGDWDGSIVSLLNYPEILRMMSDDLDWTQELGDALTYQQKDVLVAIQQLRDEAVADGILKSDDKMKVSEEDDNVVIKSADPEVVYIPQYDPQILYVPGYPPAPIAYYPTPYPQYFLPGATFFAGAVTGAIWAAAVDWNDWGVWGGRWNGGNVDINCNNCFNNRDFNGKININDIDWKNVDRSKIKIDKSQFNKFDQTNIKNNIKANTNNSIRAKTKDIKKTRPTTLPANTGSRDVRKNVQEGLKGSPGNLSAVKPNVPRPSVEKPKINKAPAKAPAARPNVQRPSKPVARPSGPAKPGARIDKRPSKPTALGNVSSGKRQKVASGRGKQSMKGHAPRRGGGGGGRRHR